MTLEQYKEAKKLLYELQDMTNTYVDNLIVEKFRAKVYLARYNSFTYFKSKEDVLFYMEHYNLQEGNDGVINSLNSQQ